MTDLRPEELAEIKKNLDEHIETQTPLPGNICKACSGEVVKKVTGLYMGKFFYSFPECNKCGRIYFYATNAPTVGEEAFRRILEQPFTI